MTLFQFVLGMTIYNVMWETVMHLVRQYQLEKEFKRINKELHKRQQDELKGVKWQ